MAKIVLVGYGEMLYSLIEGVKLNPDNQILGVFRVDRIHKDGLGLFLKDIFNPSKDYTVIKSNKLYDIKAKSVNDPDFKKEIEKLKPDLIIVGSWPEKFKKDILQTVTCVNFHPALLPKNRGANPYFWTIYLNQKVSGLTIHFMNEEFDKGDIILQEAITIDEIETGASLKSKTTRLAKIMVRDFLDIFDKNQIQPIVQNEEFASYEHQLSLNEIIVDLNKPLNDVSRHLRALYPFSSPYIKMGLRYIKINKYEFLEKKDDTIKPYKIVENNKKYSIISGSNFLIKIFK